MLVMKNKASGRSKAVFLDRDGTLIKLVYNAQTDSIDSVSKASEVETMYDFPEVLRKLKDLGYLLIIVSNQPRVGLKKLSKETYEQIKKRVDEEFEKKGIVFDAQYYCLHHPWAEVAEYRKECECRKPKIKFFQDAQKEFSIDLARSWTIGDGINDVLAGHAAGIKTILIGNSLEAGYLSILQEQLKGVKPDFIVKKPKEILKIITE